MAEQTFHPETEFNMKAAAVHLLCLYLSLLGAVTWACDSPAPQVSWTHTDLSAEIRITSPPEHLNLLRVRPRTARRTQEAAILTVYITNGSHEVTPRLQNKNSGRKSVKF